MTRSRFLTSAALTLAVLLGGCIDRTVTGPAGTLPIAPFNHPIQGMLGPGEAHGYLVPADPGRHYRPFLLDEGTPRPQFVAVEVTDPLQRWRSSGSGGRPPNERSTSWFRFESDDPHLLQVRNLSHTESVAYSLLVSSPSDSITPGRVFADAVFSGVRQYNFDGRAGEEYIAVLEGSATVEIFRQSQHLHPYEGSSPTPRSSGRVRLETDGPHQVVVRGNADYELGLFRIDQAPRQASAAFVVGDTLHEKLEHAGDIDEFFFDGRAGQEVVLRWRHHRGIGVTGSRVELWSGSELLGALSPDASHRYSPLLQLRSDGEHRVRVLGPIDASPNATAGEYELEVYAIDRRPRAVPERFELDQQVAGERIDRMRDIDEYRLTVTGDTSVAVDVRAAEPGVGPFRLEIVEAATDSVVHMFLSGAAVYTHTLPRGEYVVRVLNGTEHSMEGIPGAYEFILNSIRRAPEAVPAALVPGQPVRGEKIDHPYDVDVFRFFGAQGREVLVALVQRDGTQPVLRAHIDDALSFAWYGSHPATLGSDIRTAPAGVVTLPQTGYHEVYVQSHEPVQFTGPIAYELLVTARDPQPENVPARIAPGQVVTGEAIDHPGDLDEFEVELAAGQYLTALGRLGPGAVGPIQAHFGDRHFNTAGIDLSADWTILGASVAGAQGTYRIRISSGGSTISPLIFVGHGPYELLPLVGSSAPESVTPLIAIGDTIRGESIDEIGDVDIFEFDAIGGDDLRLHLNAMGRTLSITLWDDAGNRLGADWATCTAVCNFGSFPGRIHHTGRYHLRFRSTTMAAGPYEFALIREAN
jgi:hypothetical protein